MAGDDQSHTNSSPPASTQQRYLTRASTSGANKTALYDAKYHPMDDVTRPSQARKHKKHRGISISSEDDEEENFSPFTRHSPSPFSSSDGNNPANCDSPWQPRERSCAGYLLRKPPAFAPIYKKTWHPQDKELGIAHRHPPTNSNQVRAEPSKKRKGVRENSQSEDERSREPRKRNKVFLIGDDSDGSSSPLDKYALEENDSGMQSTVDDIVAEANQSVASKNRFQTRSPCDSHDRQGQGAHKRARLVLSLSARPRGSTAEHMNTLSSNSEEALHSCSDRNDDNAAIRDLPQLPCIACGNTHGQDDSDSAEFNVDNTPSQITAQEALEMRGNPENHDDHDFYRKSIRPTRSQDGLSSEVVATEETYHPISPGFSSSPPSPRRTSAKDGAKQADRIEDTPLLDSTYSSGKPMLEAPGISIPSKLPSSRLREAYREAAAAFEAKIFDGHSRSGKSTPVEPYQCPVSDEFLASMCPIILHEYVKERQSHQSGSVDCDSISGLSMRRPSSTRTEQTLDKRLGDNSKKATREGNSLSEEVTREAACEVDDPGNETKTDRSLKDRGFHRKGDAETKDQDMRNKQRQASSMQPLSRYQSRRSPREQSQTSAVPDNAHHPSPDSNSLARKAVEAGLRKRPKMQPTRDPHDFRVHEDTNSDRIDSAQLPQTRHFDDVNQENLRFGSDGQMDEREDSNAGDNFIATVRKPTEMFCSTKRHQIVASNSSQASSHGDEVQTRPPTAAVFSTRLRTKESPVWYHSRCLGIQDAVQDLQRAPR
ncbi:MAG: hypothetical protein M1822_006231 [Bathelium mastoideum]|nr:MAG: hypothetical protein M1822_006231 [Bathelium mastoideum]